MEQVPGTPPEGPQQAVPPSHDATGLAQPGLQQPNYGPPQGGYPPQQPNYGAPQQPGGYPPPQQGGFPPQQQGGFQQPGYGPPQGYPPPASPPTLKAKPWLIGGAVLALVLVVGAAVALTGGDEEKPKVAPLPARTLSELPSIAAEEPSPAAPVAGPYTQIASPCTYLSKATISSLVPFVEMHSAKSKDGPGANNAFETCTWQSKYQRGAAKQINRDLKVKVSLSATDDNVKDAVVEATRQFKYSLDTANKDAGKTNFLGDPYGPVTTPQIAGADEAYSQSHLNAKIKIRTTETKARVGNINVEVRYSAHDVPRGAFLDSSKNTPGDEAKVTAGAEKAAAELVAGVKACPTCTQAPAAQPDPATRPENAPVKPVNPAWSRGILKGLVDPCALVPEATLTRLIAQRTMQRIADQGYTSGSDMSTATCIWSAQLSGDQPMRKIKVNVTYRSTVAKAKQTLGWAFRDFNKYANKTDTIGIKYGPVESIVSLGDRAAVQSSVTTTPLGQGTLAMQVGNVVVEVVYSGGDGVSPMTPLPASTVTDEAKAVARDVVATLRP